MLLQNLQAEFADSLLDELVPFHLATPRAHLLIHRNTSVANLLYTLSHIYPLSKKLLGDDFFLMIARDYIKLYPSYNSDINEYGEHFCHFLGESALIRQYSFMKEVALFEWSCHQVQQAADAAVFCIEALRQLSMKPHTELFFSLPPASRLIKFRYPILRIVDLCDSHLDELVHIGEGGINMLILRRNGEIKLISLSLADFNFLNALSNGLSIADAEETARHFEPSFNLETKLPRWVTDQIIVDCYAAP